jgi:hypothetical protein
MSQKETKPKKEHKQMGENEWKKIVEVSVVRKTILSAHNLL